MVLVDGHVYMGHGHNKGLPLCMDLISGTVEWGPVRGPGSGSAAIAYADGHLYFRYENARMALVKATPSGYRLKSDFRIPSNLGKSWPHPAIARKRLYLRDQDVLLCYDLAKTRLCLRYVGTISPCARRAVWCGKSGSDNSEKRQSHLES